MKKAIIIGAGITGLSAGINALLKGYEVEIYEKNESSGGCCGGWFRSNYYIDNCMHWLTGTNQHTKLFKLWKKLGAMDETSNLYQGHYFYKSFYEGESISLYSNTEKVRNEMIRLSPEDRKEIDMFINTVNYMLRIGILLLIFLGMSILTTKPVKRFFRKSFKNGSFGKPFFRYFNAHDLDPKRREFAVKLFEYFIPYGRMCDKKTRTVTFMKAGV